MNKKLFVPILLFLVLFSKTYIHGITEMQNVDKTVRVAYVNSKRYQEGGEGEYKTGFGYEYLQRISYITGWKYEYYYGSFPELFKMLINGEVDIMGDISYTPERAEYINYSMLAEMQDTYSLITRNTQQKISLDKQDSLNGKKIGVTKNSYQKKELEKWLDERNLKCIIVEAESGAKLLEDLSRGDLDAACTADSLINYGFKLIAKIGGSDVYFGVNKNRPDLLEELNSAMAHLVQQNPYFNEELYLRYVAKNSDSQNRGIYNSEYEWIVAHKYLRIGFLYDNSPYCSFDKTTKTAKGLLPDLIKEIFKQFYFSEYSVHYRPYRTYESLKQALMDDEVDLIFPVYDDFYIAEQEEFVISQTITDEPLSIYYKENWNDIKSTEIAVPENKLIKFLIPQVFPESSIIYFKTPQECLLAIEEGHAKCAVLNTIQTQKLTNRFKNINVISLQESLKISFATTRANRVFINLLNRGLELVPKTFISNAIRNHAAKAMTYTLADVISTYRWFFTAFLFFLLLLVFVILKLLSQREKLLYVSKELDIACRKADNANNAKSAFLFNMSHDIRTPTNAIIGFTDIAKEYINEPKKLLECIDKIQISGKYLLNLINEILDLASIENGKLNIVVSSAHLKQITDNVYTIINETAEENGIPCRLEYSDIIHNDIYADVVRLEQILMNILGNAVKYSRKGNPIVFAVKEIPVENDDIATYVFTVKDSGIGMSEDFQKHIFEPFIREKNTSENSVQGIGLGMTIARQLIDLLGGTIQIESKLNEGTTVTVTFTFKLAEPAADEKEAEAEKQEILDSISLKGRRALVVEDNKLNREITKHILEKNEIIVDEAEDGLIALEKVKAADAGYYDFILMDIQMPNMNGYTATKEIRSLEDAEKAQTPIVAMTANAFEEDRVKAYDCGMNGHLIKPINVDAMISMLKSLVR